MCSKEQISLPSVIRFLSTNSNRYFMKTQRVGLQAEDYDEIQSSAGRNLRQCGCEERWLDTVYLFSVKGTSMSYSLPVLNMNSKEQKDHSIFYWATRPDNPGVRRRHYEKDDLTGSSIRNSPAARIPLCFSFCFRLEMIPWILKTVVKTLRFEKEQKRIPKPKNQLQMLPNHTRHACFKELSSAWSWSPARAKERTQRINTEPMRRWNSSALSPVTFRTITELADWFRSSIWNQFNSQLCGYSVFW